MVFRDKAPSPRIFRIMPVVAHHPVIIHFESLLVGFRSIKVQSVRTSFQFISLIYGNRPLIEGECQTIQRYRPAFFGDDYGTEIIDVPRIQVVVWKYSRFGRITVPD